MLARIHIPLHPLQDEVWASKGKKAGKQFWDQVLGKATRARPIGHKLIAEMHQTIAVLSKAGHNVIVDHVLTEPALLYNQNMGSPTQSLAAMEASTALLN